MTNAVRSPEKSVHILFTGLFMKNVLSGGDQLIFDIAPRLPRDIKKIIIMPHFAVDHWASLPPMKNTEFRLLPPNRFEFKPNLLFVFLCYVVRSFQVYRILRRETIQTMYSCSDVAYADIWPAYFIRRKVAPQAAWISRVYHVLLPPQKRHGNHFVNMLAFRLQKLSFWMMKKKSTTIFALNIKLYDELVALDFPKEKLSILGAGISFDEINSFKQTKKYPYDIVAMGRVAPVKGVFDAVDIWEKVHKEYPSLQLAWVGSTEGGFAPKIEKMLKQKNLQDSFHLLGFTDKHEAYNILRSAKVFICPDHENGWGLAVCEAMALGLPVASYNLDIFGGIYRKGYVSAPLFDTKAFADNLTALLSDKKTLESIGKDAIAQASEFDHARVLRTLKKYL